MTIRTESPFPGMWTAVDDDTYDGAPDGRNEIGYGQTPEAAIADLLELQRENDEAWERHRQEEWEYERGIRADKHRGVPGWRT